VDPKLCFLSAVQCCNISRPLVLSDDYTYATCPITWNHETHSILALSLRLLFLRRRRRKRKEKKWKLHFKPSLYFPSLHSSPLTLLEGLKRTFRTSPFSFISFELVHIKPHWYLVQIALKSQEIFFPTSSLKRVRRYQVESKPQMLSHSLPSTTANLLQSTFTSPISLFSSIKRPEKRELVRCRKKKISWLFSVIWTKYQWLLKFFGVLWKFPMVPVYFPARSESFSVGFKLSSFSV